MMNADSILIKIEILKRTRGISVDPNPIFITRMVSNCIIATEKELIRNPY